MARKRKRFTFKRKRRSAKRSGGFSLKGMTGGIGGQLQAAAAGAAGIALNQFLTNQVVKLAKIDPKNRQMVLLGSALFLMPMLGRFAGKFRGMVTTAAQVAAAVAIFEAGKKYLPAPVTAHIAGMGSYSTYQSGLAQIAGMGCNDTGGLPSIYDSAGGSCILPSAEYYGGPGPRLLQMPTVYATD